MKSILYFLLFTISPLSMFSQVATATDKVIYLDSLYKETEQDKYVYVRIVKDYETQKDNYTVQEYYKSGKLKSEGISLERASVRFDGEFISYYENGNKKTSSNFVKGIRNGSHYEWYENGNKKVEGKHTVKKSKFIPEYEIYQFWDKNNIQKVIDGNGDYEGEDENSYEKGKMKNGLKEGIWKGENNRKSKYSEEYKKGVLVSGISTDEYNNEYKYTVLAISPKPIKGIQHFYNHIAKNFTCPKEYENLKGRILTNFIVDKDGELVEPKNIQSLNETLDQEAIRAITSYGKWKPGQYRGQNIRVVYTIPISLAGKR